MWKVIGVVILLVVAGYAIYDEPWILVVLLVIGVGAFLLNRNWGDINWGTVIIAIIILAFGAVIVVSGYQLPPPDVLLGVSSGTTSGTSSSTTAAPAATSTPVPSQQFSQPAPAAQPAAPQGGHCIGPDGQKYANGVRYFNPDGSLWAYCWGSDGGWRAQPPP